MTFNVSVLASEWIFWRDHVQYAKWEYFCIS